MREEKQSRKGSQWREEQARGRMVGDGNGGVVECSWEEVRYVYGGGLAWRGEEAMSLEDDDDDDLH